MDTRDILQGRRIVGPGDCVYVKPGVHDERMPDERHGLIVEMVGQHGWNTPNKLGLPDQVLVLFSNNQVLKFHKSQLKIAESADAEK